MENPSAARDYGLLQSSAGLLDLSSRGRLCLTGADRIQFLHGQVTNDVKKLNPGQGCYAALVNAKGKIESDLNIYALADEILLDFEPGLTERITQRLEKFVIADDVQVVDVAGLYGLLSVQGPEAAKAAAALGKGPLPEAPFSFISADNMYVMNNPRLGSAGFDIFAPSDQISEAARTLEQTCPRVSSEAFEIARIEAGIPRYGVDMDETNLAPEAGIAPRAISYSKGCYIGQEVIARIRTYGQVAKNLRRLRFLSVPPRRPLKGDKLSYQGKECGYITSAATLPNGQMLALGYVRKEVPAGAEVELDQDAARFTISQLSPA